MAIRVSTDRGLLEPPWEPLWIECKGSSGSTSTSHETSGALFIGHEKDETWVNLLLYETVAYGTPIAKGAKIWNFCKGQQNQDGPIILKALFISICSRDEWLLQARIFYFGCWRWGLWPADLLRLAKKNVVPDFPHYGHWDDDLDINKANIGPTGTGMFLLVVELLKYFLYHWQRTAASAPHSHPDPSLSPLGSLWSPVTKRLLGTARGLKNAFDWLVFSILKYPI